MPPCLTRNAFSLRSAVTLPARHVGITSQLLEDLHSRRSSLQRLRPSALFISARPARLLSPRPRRPIYRNCVCPAPTIPDSLRNRLPVLLPRHRFKVSQYVNILSPLWRTVKGFHRFPGLWVPGSLSPPGSLPPAFPGSLTLHFQLHKPSIFEIPPLAVNFFVKFYDFVSAS